MSGITYRYTNETVKMIKDVKNLIKESIIDGDKGLSFMLITKAGDKFHRIYVKKMSDDNYSFTEKKDDKETEKTLTFADVTKMVKSSDELEFVGRYLKDTKHKGGAKKSSKKSSKKMSGGKKGSRSASKKGSRSAPKKTSKKGSRKH